jgi:hypothetical protein
MNETSHIKFLSEDSKSGPLIFRGGNIQRYTFLDESKQGRDLFLNEHAFLSHHKVGKVEHVRVQRYGYQRKAALDNWKRLIASPLPANVYCFDSISYFIDEGNKSLFFLSLLNGQLLEWRFGVTSTNNTVSTDEIGSLPIRRIHFTTAKKDRSYLLKKFKKLYQEYLFNNKILLVTEYVDQLLPKDEEGKFFAFKENANGAEEKSDVVHDFLAFLAEEMIRLNKEKQTELKRYLTWLEKKARITEGIDSLPGKTTIKNYLGDYQKNESEAPFEEILKVLQKNRNKIGISLNQASFVSELKKEYEASLAKLIPIKKTLAATDTLIDQVVYKLYGLTEEEIKIVEGNT